MFQIDSYVNLMHLFFLEAGLILYLLDRIDELKFNFLIITVNPHNSKKCSYKPNYLMFVFQML